MMRAVRLAVSIGCPCGIGPEVSLAGALALRRKRPQTQILLVGDLGALRCAARTIGVDPSCLVRVRTPQAAWTASESVAVFESSTRLAASDRKAGAPTHLSGRAQLTWIDTAMDLVAAGEADALVTGPVSKEAIARSGGKGARDFLGHTEHLAERLGAAEVTMAFYSKVLTTSLVTTHLPLSAVARAIKPRSVARAAFWTAWLVERMHDARKGRAKRVVVAGLNPHAGEHGLLGPEEQRAIAPGIALAKRRIKDANLDVELVGPVPAESAFRVAAGGGFEAVVAMYHDQATIPMKLLGFGEAVNVSLGLPIVRTSVDHGTAYDRAGKGAADPRGMVEAMQLAVRLVIAERRRGRRR